MKTENMEKQEHIERHKVLHKELDELIADFMQNTNNMPSQTTILELMRWSFEQTEEKQ